MPRSCRWHQQEKLVAALIVVSALLCLSNLWFISLQFEEPELESPRSVPHNRAHSRHNVHVVVSHCDRPIGWIWDHFSNEERRKTQPNLTTEYVLKSVSIISKCNVSIAPSDLRKTQTLIGSNDPEPLVQVISLPNVGRCDHSYAYWIKEVLLGTKNANVVNDIDNTAKGHSKTNQTHPLYEILYSNQQHDGNPFHNIATSINETDLVLFMKDNDNSYRFDRLDIGLSGVLDILTTQDHPSTAAPTSYSSLKTSKILKPISRGLACQAYPNSLFMDTKRKRWRNKFTNIAHRSILWGFEMPKYDREERDLQHEFRSPYRPMRTWIKHLAGQERESRTIFSSDYYEHAMRNMIDREDGYFYKARYRFFSAHPQYSYRITKDGDFSKYSNDYVETDLVPVCFGGVFATYWGQVTSDDSPLTIEGWKAVTQSLSRGNNIEEGHFMERWWGDLFSWSSWAQKTFSSQSMNTTQDAADQSLEQDQRNKSFPGKAVSLPEEEQLLLLEDKLSHMPPNHPFAGVVVLDRGKLE